MLLPFKYGQKVDIYGVPKSVYVVKIKLFSDYNMLPVFTGENFATFLVDQTASNGIYLCETGRVNYVNKNENILLPQ